MTGSLAHPPVSSPPERSARPSGFTAVLAGLLALPAAVAAGYAPIQNFLDMPAEFSLGALPGWVLADLGAFLVAGLLLLLGSLVTLFRAAAGPVLLGLGALLAIGALLTEPLAAGVPLGRFVDAVFTHGGLAMVDRAGLAALAVFVLVLAFLPPTFRYLRAPAAPVPVFDGRSAYPSRGW